MIEIKGKGGITAKIVAHSKSSVDGKEIITYELEYPRFIHCEILTHRMLSRNCASSRAIPVKTMLENLNAAPIYWGKNKSGMQAEEELDVLLGGDSEFPGFTREEYWQDAKELASIYAEEYANRGYHKQIVNRLIEPFQMIKAVVTATEWDNFFWLRNDLAAQPELQELARCMLEARKDSKPAILKPKDWHLPYYEGGCWEKDGGGIDKYGFTLLEARIMSAARCAAVSYRKTDYTLEKCLEVYTRLVGDERKHASAFEHQATPMVEPNFWCGDCQNQPDWEDGVSHADKNGKFWSGNFQSWIQYRQLIPGHVCTNYNYDVEVE